MNHLTIPSLPASLATPCYYYDLSLLRHTLSTLQALLQPHPNYHLHYAIKANANPQLLSIIAAHGLGADCVSGGEIEAALAAQFPATGIVFAGVGKTDTDIRTALAANIHAFNVESLQELSVINDLAQSMHCTARVALRVNPNVDAHTHQKITTGLDENKFGISLESIIPTVQHILQLPAIQLTGLHFHIGSQILDLSVYAALCQRINALQDDLNHQGIHLTDINVGGGLGIDYQHPLEHPIPDFQAYFDTFTQHLQLRAGQQLHFELGRSIVAQCGVLLSRVLYVKEGKTKKFLIVDAGFTDLLRPALYGAHHFTQNLTALARPTAATELYDVVGPICESSDVFSTDEQLPLSQRGDLIAFYSAGAYGEVMASTYNCRHLPTAFYYEP